MRMVFDIAARRAELTPGRTAFIEVASGKELTYRALNERAARFAAALKDCGPAVTAQCASCRCSTPRASICTRCRC